MVDSPLPEGVVEEKFSLPLFLFTVAASLAGLVVLLKLAAPDAVWQAQVSASVGQFAGVFLAVTMFNCFMEYGFHRYVLHKPVVPFLSRFYKQHTLHHNLTRIGRRRTPGGREVPFVENMYPVTTPEQGEASFFPWYTLAVFGAIFTPLYALGQWLLPSFPWFFAGFAALAGSIALYEIFHAIEHWSFEKWGPLIEHPRLGWFWRKVYSFHLRHHAVIDCNEAISGFFTLPVADWVFGTFLLPKSLYVDGSEWNATEFTSPRPCAFIRWCDTRTDALVKNRRARAQGPVAAPSGEAATIYTRGEQIANYLTHGTGLLASIVGLVLLTSFAALRGNAWHVASSVVFGLALVFGYAAFMNFRRTRTPRGRAPFTRRNHVAIFFLIAGTATPFLLLNVRGAWGWSLFGVVWGLCLVGALFRLFFTGRLQTVSTFAYLLIGLLPFVAIKPLIAALPNGALWLLLVGVLCYLCGTVFHLWQRLHYHLVMRHVFALGGTACHLLAVLLFVLPGQG
ncbi:MAG: hemolysin III family protein [Verrucomicrobia bacterium]|nr:hemolysin III family protein [Verrucomicrobiota bacterium]